MKRKNNDEQAKFAFLIHPRTDVRGDLAKAVHPLCRYIPLPDKWIEGLIKFFPPIASGKIMLNDVHYGYIIFVPLSARLMLEKRRAKSTRKKILAAVKKAREKGCQLVGLGALTAPLTGGGLLLKNKVDGVSITNGNALTAGVTVKAVERLLGLFPYQRDKVKIAVVGATGSVGAGVSKFLAKQGFDLLLIGNPDSVPEGASLDFQNNPGLKQLYDSLLPLYNSLAADNHHLSASLKMEDLQDSDIVLVTTSAAKTLIKRKHLKKGAIVYDDTQPRNTDPQLQYVDDVLILDGGWLMAPGLDITVNIDLPAEHAYACLVETFLLLLNDRLADYCVGKVKYEQVVEMLELFEKSNFKLARFRSFGKYVARDKWDYLKLLIAQNNGTALA